MTQLKIIARLFGVKQQSITHSKTFFAYFYLFAICVLCFKCL